MGLVDKAASILPREILSKIAVDKGLRGKLFEIIK
jgi:hypothetical protein